MDVATIVVALLVRATSKDAANLCVLLYSLKLKAKSKTCLLTFELYL